MHSLNAVDRGLSPRPSHRHRNPRGHHKNDEKRKIGKISHAHFNFLQRIFEEYPCLTMKMGGQNRGAIDLGPTAHTH